METFLNDKVTLHCGDCLDVLATLDENSIDSCVTDPPYHLTSIVKRFGKCEPRSNLVRDPNTIQDWGSPYMRAAAGFMGKQWDGGDIAFRPEMWAAVYRVLKPGAHLVAFGGDRTQHRLACAIEDAGFEIRGTLVYLFGSGFPKNHDVSKRMREYFLADDVCACDHHSTQTVQDLTNDCSSCCRPDGEQFRADQDSDQGVFPSQDDAHVHSRGDQRMDDRERELTNTVSDAANGRRASEDSFCPLGHQSEDSQFGDSARSDTSSNKSNAGPKVEHRTAARKLSKLRSGDGLVDVSARDVNLSRCPYCGKIQIAEGLGTALKPAAEFICLARKPLSEKTVAANVLKWGTGAINVDGCRVETGEDLNGGRYSDNKIGDDGNTYGNGINGRSKSDYSQPRGRWPANVIHDGSDEVVAAFPDTGVSTGGGMKDLRKGKLFLGETNPNVTDSCGFGDSGSAARFFYTAKADSDDRIGSKHPTVKPVDLMQYLVRLITPKGGTVLDPFAGTGTTGEAAWREGMNAVLIEREDEYCGDIRRRMALALAGPDERTREGIKARGQVEHDPGPLFQRNVR